MSEPPSSSASRHVPFLTALVCGGFAGTSVDVALFPIDTIKTRLQSPHGFVKAGGFNGIYKGISAAAAGSAPGAALFFSVYELSKRNLSEATSSSSNDSPPSSAQQAGIHMTAASAGEVAACLVRVPTEIIKQRMQAGIHSSFVEAVTHAYKTKGVMGFYSGYGTTIMREIPFAFIQFPIYEALKRSVKKYKEANGSELYSVESALCGSFGGAIAAAATTPLDVIKTRLMLGSDSRGVPYKGFLDTYRRIKEEGAAVISSSRSSSSCNGSSNSVSISSTNSINSGSGSSNSGKSSHGSSSVGNGNGSGSGGRASSLSTYRVFFSGVQPRVMWISIGGFVFFGAYELAVNRLIS